MLHCVIRERGAPPDLAPRFHAARADRGLAVLEGFHALKHALRFGASVELAVTVDREAALGLVAALAWIFLPHLRETLVEVPKAFFARLAPVAPVTGVLALALRPAVDLGRGCDQPPEAPLVLLEDPVDLGNSRRGGAGRGRSRRGSRSHHRSARPVASDGAARLGGIALCPAGRRCAGSAGDGTLVCRPAPGGPAVGRRRAAGRRRPRLRHGTRRAKPGAARPGRPARRDPDATRRVQLKFATAVAVALYAWRFAQPHAVLQ